MSATPRPHLAQLLAKATVFTVVLLGFGFVVAIGAITASAALRESLAQALSYQPSRNGPFGPNLPLVVVPGVAILLVASVSKWARFNGRRLAIAGLCAAAALVGILLLYAYTQAVNAIDFALGMFRDSMDGSVLEERTTLLGAGIVALLTISTLAALRLPAIRWKRLGIAAGALAAILVALALDDSKATPPLTSGLPTAASPGDKQSYALLMTYGYQHPLGKNFKNPTPNRIWSTGAFMPGGDQKEWITWLKANRTDLQSDWVALAPVRDWWSQLNTYETIGDLTQPETREFVSFMAIRCYAQHASAIACLEALDGNGDKAIDTLLPVLQVARKLQAKSRAPVRTMVARVIERHEMESAAFVLSQTAVSPSKRAALRAALLLHVDAPAEIRRYYVLFDASWRQVGGCIPLGSLVFFDEPRNPWRTPLNLVSPFVYNPSRTTNLMSAFDRDAGDYAANRQVDKIEEREKEVVKEESGRLKNIVGAALLRDRLMPAEHGGGGMAVYATSFWLVEDQRAALLKQIDPKA